MAGKLNRIDIPRGFRWSDGPIADKAWGDLPAAFPAQRTGGYQALLDEGLRLNRAFIKINDPLVREAIINLVVEAAESESDEELFSWWNAGRRPAC